MVVLMDFATRSEGRVQATTLRASALRVFEGRCGMNASCCTGTMRGDEQSTARVEAAQVLTTREVRRPVERVGGPIPARVGRYEVTGSLGRGGMGVVLLGHDPELARPLALKLVHHRWSRDPAAKARLLAEARALAALRHPNVVRVFDVGEFEGGVFMAMQYVEGVTLRGWLEAGSHTWPRIVAMYLQAARGLSAAHRVGLVHRDFKPDNVMVTSSGEVRVLDFGLALLLDDPPSLESGPSDESMTFGDTGDGVRLTDFGVVLGTPGYMAPEQHLGHPVDARADQFAFCVALHEALWGVRPFRGRDGGSLLRQIRAGAFQNRRTDSSLPRWLRRAIERGLRFEPDRRWSSMDALIDVLERAGGRRRRRRALGAAWVVSGGLVAGSWLLPASPERCSGAEAEADRVWNEQRRRAVRAALERKGDRFVSDTVRSTLSLTDAYVTRWTDAHARTCATLRDAPRDAIGLDRQLKCLERRLGELESLLTAMTEGEPTVAVRAVEALDQLPRPGRCGDVNANVVLDSGDGLDDPEIRRLLDHARAFELTGAYEHGLKLANRALERAQASQSPGRIAEALLRRGALRVHLGKLDAGHADLEASVWQADALSLDETACEAAVQLAFVDGVARQRFDEGLRWARYGLSRARRFGEGSLQYGRAVGMLGSVLEGTGRFDEAQVELRRALDILGELEPRPAEYWISMNNLGVLHLDRGRHAQAAEIFAEVLEHERRRVGDHHPRVALSLNNLADAFMGQGKFDQAQEHFEEALAIYEDLYGPEHFDVVMVLANLGGVASAAGRHEEALPYLQRALEGWSKTLGPEHPNVAQLHNNIGSTYLELGRFDEARRHLQRALDLGEAALGPEHPLLGYALSGLGQALGESGLQDEAREALERALAIRESADAGPLELAYTRYELARVLARDSSALQRARALADKAATVWGEHEAYRADYEKARAFIEALEGRTPSR